jgi:SAM-dependent methyltransferase
MAGVYDQAFYASQADGSARSARAIVPLVMDLLAPRSVLDVGCGIGTWLEVYRRAGVGDVVGVDGEYVDRSALGIAPAQFVARDLRRDLALGRTFDLVQSLEVAEHLPPASAATFVRSLTRHGSAVLFGAAAPGQGGTDHVNEQWPAYWAALFATHGYVPVDFLRRRVWNDPRVEWWYAQNTILYVTPERLARSPRLLELQRVCGGAPALVHPRAEPLQRAAEAVQGVLAGVYAWLVK